MKRVIMSLAPLLAALLCASSAAAYETPVISASEEEAAPGETVLVEISIANNPGFLGAKLTISFPEELSLTGGTSGGVFQDAGLTMTKPGQMTSPCSFVWEGQDLDPARVKDGVALTLEFQVSETARPGQVLAVELSCEDANMIDGDLNMVPCVTYGGRVTVAEKEAGMVSASGSLMGSAVTATLTGADASRDLTVLAASYAAGGRQSGCGLERVRLEAGETKSCAIQVEQGASGYRVYVLDGQYRPCCPAVTVGN